MNAFSRSLREHLELFHRLDPLGEDIQLAAVRIATSMRSGGKLMLCGNGGSAGDAQHIAAEFTGRFVKDRRPLAGLALSTDSSALTCISNDYEFAEVFRRQVAGLGRPGDCLLAISTSGNSENVIRAVEEARGLGIWTCGFLGRDGGKLKSLCDLSLVVPSESTARIQEAHILMGHCICAQVERELGVDV